MDQISSMRTFLKVVERGSFTGAARDLLLDQAVVTRRVADLERRLGAQLLTRTTRSLKLTEVGETYLGHCRRILEEVDATEAEIASGQSIVAGRVRLAVPLAFGLEVLAPRLKEFKQRYPQIELQVVLGEHIVDVVNEGFDVAITSSDFGLPASVVSRPMFRIAFGLFAAPGYLKRAGIPRSPADLERHACINHSHEVVRHYWKLSGARGKSVSVAITPTLSTNSFPLIRQAAIDGLGIGLLPRWSAGRDAKAGLLAEVLPRWRLGTLGFTLIYARRDFVSARVRALIDFILDPQHKREIERAN